MSRLISLSGISPGRTGVDNGSTTCSRVSRRCRSGRRWRCDRRCRVLREVGYEDAGAMPALAPAPSWRTVRLGPGGAPPAHYLPRSRFRPRRPWVEHDQVAGPPVQVLTIPSAALQRYDVAVHRVGARWPPPPVPPPRSAAAISRWICRAPPGGAWSPAPDVDQVQPAIRHGDCCLLRPLAVGESGGAGGSDAAWRHGLDKRYGAGSTGAAGVNATTSMPSPAGAGGPPSGRD
jgi:hypothetical protein